MRTLYSIGIGLMTAAVRCAAPFHKKCKLMSEGWRHWRNNFSGDKLKEGKVAWFHVASLGEFEQARPVIETLKTKHPEYKIVLTFFSPSGYEVRKNYDKADVICYLPPDTRSNARRLIKEIHPDIVFFVKYEFWFNYLNELSRRGIPTYIFSAIFRDDHYFFKWHGRWFLNQLKKSFRHLFVQNETSVRLLKEHGVDNCSIAGDTRFDRVMDIASHARKFDEIEQFITDNGTRPLEEVKVLIAGSSWPPDEDNINAFLHSYNEPLKVIVAPHEIHESRLTQIENLFGIENCIRYSSLKNKNTSDYCRKKILIIDNIGMLSSIYRYATVAYIGGGFGKGIHNILEAAVFGCPVCFGPNHTHFQEAMELLAYGGAMTYNDKQQLTEILTVWLDSEEDYRKASKACDNYMQNNVGATETIMKGIELR